MSTIGGPDPDTNGRSGVKTLGIRLEPDRHAQLSLIAQLKSSTITDEIRVAIDAHIEAARTTPALAAGATGVLEDIERDAAARRSAITALFGDIGRSDTTPAPQPPTSGRKPTTR